MPKASWNIVDFSGGLNSFIDKRDIDDSESSAINDLIAYNPGSLKLAGTFIIPLGFGINELGFSDTNSMSKSLFYMQPSYHFTYYGKGTASASDSTTITMTSPAGTDHGLTNGVSITIISASITPAYVGLTYIVEDVSAATFNITHTENVSVGEDFTYIVGANYNSDLPVYLGTSGTLNPYALEQYSDPETNQFALKCDSMGRFGFFSINEGYWIGDYSVSGSGPPVNTVKTQPYLFDTEFLWDNRQSGEGFQSIVDGFYIDGVFRVISNAPTKFAKNLMKRPVNYQYIETHYKFDTSLDTGRLYHSGWYPFRSHCLSPLQYSRVPEGADIDTIYGTTFAGTLFRSTDSPATISDMIADITTDPSFPYQFQIVVSPSTAAGEWDFSTTGENSQIKLGVSLIYDNINSDIDSNSQESNISVLENILEMSPQNESKKLHIAWKIHKGVFETGYELFNLATETYSKNVGSHNGGGFANYEAWNPRVVGANIYIMEMGSTTNGIEVLDDPLYLATINFSPEKGKYGVSKDHDGKEAEDWVNVDSDLAYQGILNIASPPVQTFSFKNGYMYKWNENIHSWYKTSAVVNRRLYAGNVSYFEEFNPALLDNTVDIEEYRISNYPDRILVSPLNKLDILPVEKYLLLARLDGQSIISLQGFKQYLFIYKSNDLYILDCSGEGEELVQTFYGQGLKSDLHVVKSQEAVYSLSDKGLFACNGEEITNLSRDKIAADYWRKNIYERASRLMYDPEYNLLLITTKYDGTSDSPKELNNLLIYNTSNGSFFLKSTGFEGTAVSSYLSNPISIDGNLYCSGSSIDFQTEVYSTEETTAYVSGTFAGAEITFGTAATGTWPGPSAGTCEAGQLSEDVAFIKYQVDSDDKWYALNDQPLFGLKDKLTGGVTAGRLEELNNRALIEAINNIPMNSGDSDYYVNQCFLLGDENNNPNKIRLEIRAVKKGAAYNFLAEDLSSTVGAVYDENTAIAFSKYPNGSAIGETHYVSGTVSTAGLEDGNLDYFSDAEVTNATSPTAPVFKIQVNRNGNTNLGSQYVLEFIREGTSSNNNQTYTFIYEIGVNYFEGTDYTAGTETSGVEATDDFNLLTNLREALDNHIRAEESNDISIETYCNIGNIIGSGSTAYFNLTLRPYEDYQALYNYVDWTFNGYVVSGDFNNVAKLLKWTNEVPLDSNESSLISSHSLNLETKDIDFGEPNVRKKVYKAYITYTNGEGNIKCSYQADQSGTWTDATVKDADGATSTAANRLNDSSTQTRAELKFGTGGNNIYSFALRFEAVEVVNEFEINDITIIYRLKKPK